MATFPRPFGTARYRYWCHLTLITRHSASRYFITAVGILILLTRIPGLDPAVPGRLLNVDELEVTLSTLDRFAGVPSTTLVKPGGPLQLLSVPVFLADFVLERTFKATPSAFLDYLSDAYRNPWRHLGLVRTIVAILSTIGFALLFGSIRQRENGSALAILTILLLATLPEVWMHSHMAVGDAMALGLACATMAILKPPEPSQARFAVAGLVFGLAVATKLTFIVLLPFLLAIGCEGRRNRFLRCVLLFMLGLLGGFVAGCPYVWTDPIRLAKAVIGNASKPGEPLGLLRALEMMVQVIPWWILVPFLMRMIRSLVRGRWMLALCAGLALFVPLMTAMRSGIFFPRYYLPAALPAVLLGAAELLVLRDWVASKWRGNGVINANSAMIAAVVLMAAVNVWIYSARLKEKYTEQEVVAALVADLRQVLVGQRAMLPAELFPYLADQASKECLTRMADVCRGRMERGESVVEFAGGRGLADDIVRALPSAFNEREQAFVARMTIMARRAPAAGADIHLWTEPAAAARCGLATPAEALAAFQTRQADILVLDRCPVSLTPFRSYNDRYYLFQSEAGRPIPSPNPGHKSGVIGRDGLEPVLVPPGGT